MDATGKEKTLKGSASKNTKVQFLCFLFLFFQNRASAVSVNCVYKHKALNVPSKREIVHESYEGLSASSVLSMLVFAGSLYQDTYNTSA